jgi:hypothetical protein
VGLAGFGVADDAVRAQIPRRHDADRGRMIVVADAAVGGACTHRLQAPAAAAFTCTTGFRGAAPCWTASVRPQIADSSIGRLTGGV